MPEIEIRPAVAADLPAMLAIEHIYSSDYVWQMEVQTEENQVAVTFREVRLPRAVRVEYPRSTQVLAEEWTRRSAFLAAVLGGEVVGYACIDLNLAPLTAWVTDLAVQRRLRRQGIGSALVLAAQDWGAEHHCRRLVLEMQPKNYPAIRMAQKLGLDLSGYNDHYYLNFDTALFFARGI
jgi:GNAT superfamily N-acetyltransferase